MVTLNFDGCKISLFAKSEPLPFSYKENVMTMSYQTEVQHRDNIEPS